MADKVQITTDVRPATDGPPPAAPTPPKRSPGHRGADVRDTVAEMAAKAARDQSGSGQQNGCGDERRHQCCGGAERGSRSRARGTWCSTWSAAAK